MELIKAPDKENIFLFLHDNTECCYSLGAPLRDTHNVCFHSAVLPYLEL